MFCTPSPSLTCTITLNEQPNFAHFLVMFNEGLERLKWEWYPVPEEGILVHEFRREDFGFQGFDDQGV